MAIAGFPDEINVTLGDAWAGRFGMDPNDVLLLQKVSGQDKWSEDGTTTFHTTNNRLMIGFGHGSVDFIDLYVINWTTGAFTIEVQINLTTGQANNGTIYNFKDIFDDTQTSINIQHNFGPTFMSNFTGYQTDFNPSFFKAIEDADAPIVLPGDVGAYTVGGTAANLLDPIRIAAGAGAYTIAGTEVDLLTDRFFRSGANHMDGLGGGGPFFKDPLA